MKHIRTLPLLPAFAFLAAAPLFGQDGSGITQEEEQHAQERMSPTFVKAPIGSGAAIDNDAGERLGVVRDFVIDRRGGKVKFVAVGPAGDSKAQAHLVPYSRFSWDPEQQRLLLPINAEELDSMPHFDPMNLPPFDDIGRVGGGAGSSPGSLAGEPREAAVLLPDLVSSEILGSSVVAVGEEFASVRDLVLEPEQGTIAFILASGDSPEDSPYVIPWQAMTWTESGDDRSHFALTNVEGDLAQAPRLEKGDMSRLVKKENLEAIYSFYALETPILRASGSAPSH
jgi:sporulation protein YlmC with PRC-barrel domain